MCYGSGWFAPKGARVTAYNFFSEAQLAYVQRTLEFLRGMEDYSLGPRYHPDSPGHVMWGEDVNGAMLLWLAQGPPDQWPVVVQPPRYHEVQRLDMSATTFLAKSFKREISSMIWSPSFFSGDPVYFEPRIQRSFGG